VDLDFEQLASLPPDSEEQQEIVYGAQAQDGFNWGYDPFHFNAPEGSYSTDPDGPQRIIEFREMVKALNENGLRVVVDVVYNHTNASGQSEKSVLDKVVPGYYHRLDGNGRMSRSTCCENTATEHDMMRKLMVDSVILWATVYKVDGFRFDLMGHHMVEDMIAVREALDNLTMAEHGVDGRAIYVYGEGWDFGEVGGNARGRNATQLDVGGLGIGTFNDRLRDAVRGGNPFGGYLEQGFATGLYTIPNEHESRADSIQQLTLFRFADQVRVGLAGNLADYTLIDGQGNEVRGRDIDYNGSPTGYTFSPEEHIVYVSAHDNETLFDAVQFKAPGDMGLADRVRMQNLALSVVSMSQGIPFFHAGSDILRSKSFDRDSYDSGDWYNRIDFTLESNNFGIGLPNADKNQEHWEIMAPLLARTDLVPQREHMLANHNHILEMLQIRYSSPLFRLQTADQVMARVAFHNTGPDQIPGLIVMSLSDAGHAETLDPDHDLIVVLFNGSGETVRFAEASLAGTSFSLHPIQQNSADAVVQTAVYDANSGSFEIPGLTTAVFVAATGAETAEPEATPEPVVEEETVAVEETAEQPDPITEPETVEPDSADFLNLGGVAAATALAILVGVAGYVVWQRREN
ncbi:MAG: pullulanase-type alpha-1,6-glucosidase, partial [Chloroflexota bacterium]